MKNIALGFLTVATFVLVAHPAQASAFEPGTISLCVIAGERERPPQPSFMDYGSPCYTYTGVEFPWDLDATEEIVSVRRNGQNVPVSRFDYNGLLYEPARNVLTPGKYKVKILSEVPAQWKCSMYWKDICKWFKASRDYTVWSFTWDGSSVSR